MNFEIEKTLVASLDHLESEELYKVLKSEYAIFYNKVELILYVGCVPFYFGGWKSKSKELTQLTILCRENSCQYLKLSLDADYIDEINTFDWE